ncbi:FolC bifunctional protein [Xylaria palmicola]|nr:FolC bifunctional protein [Xylaria palmicola]
MARTYESALAHLAALQSNRAVTSLFSPPAVPASPSSAPRDLNALAIPEMLAWLRRAGLEPDDLGARLRCVHVAGTKGKGSVCAHLTALLLARGDAGRVGTYTSPHLASVRERIAIDGAPISRALFARYFFEVWDACTEAARAELLAARRRAAAAAESRQSGHDEDEKREKAEEEELPLLSEAEEAELRGPATKPFYFRFLTILALRAFLGEGVRSAVVECGIGGEYDSTNVLPPAAVTVAVVTQLGIDHVGMLGGTLPEIAWHKAGVCKPGRKCFTRRLGGGRPAAAETVRVLRERAAEKGAALVEVDDAEVEGWGGVPGALEGEFQKYNQALAVYAAREHLRVLASEASPEGGAGEQGPTDERLADVPASFTAALRNARLRGRCETLEDEHAPVTWLVDGAHTAESLAEVARWFAGKNAGRTDGARAILLFNQQDRDAAKFIGGLLADIRASALAAGDGKAWPLFAHAIFARNDLAPRAVSDDEAGGETEPERDLSAQRAAADALRAVSPATSTSVLDNVADAVAEIRGLALAGRADDGRRTIALVTGSLHLVGALVRTLEPDAED